LLHQDLDWQLARPVARPIAPLEILGMTCKFASSPQAVCKHLKNAFGLRQSLPKSRSPGGIAPLCWLALGTR
jgi:hypothetical protein